MWPFRIKTNPASSLSTHFRRAHKNLYELLGSVVLSFCEAQLIKRYNAGTHMYHLWS
jgi:hypothetical protein